MQPEASAYNSKLVDADGLLNSLFDPSCRPSLRWLRQQQKARSVPYVRIGRLIFFDVEAVRNALTETMTVRAL